MSPKHLPVQRVLVLAAIAALVAAALHDPRPALVREFGGERIAWNADYISAYGAVTRCLRFADTTPSPALQIWQLPDSTPPILVGDSLRSLRGMYDGRANAIVLMPRLTDAERWAVFSHEVAHERIGDPNHERWEWGEWKRCGMLAP